MFSPFFSLGLGSLLAMLALLGTVVGTQTDTIPTSRQGLWEGNCLYPLSAGDIRPGVVGGRQRQVITLIRTGANATWGPFTFVDPTGTSRSVTLTVPGSTTAGDASSAKTQLGQLSYVTKYWHVTVGDGTTYTTSTTVLTAKNADQYATSVADTDGNLTSAEATAPSTGTNLQAGRLVIDNGIGSAAGTNGAYLGIYLQSSTLTAQVVAYDFSGVVAADTVETTIIIPAYADESGIAPSISVTTPFHTSQAVTLAEHVVSLNAQLDQVFGAGQSVVAALATAKFSLTAEIAGLAFHSIITVGGGRTGTAVIDASTSLPATGLGVGNRTYDHLMRLFGVIERGGAKESSVGAGDAVFEPGRAFLAIRRNEGVILKNADTVAQGQRGWLSMGSTTLGQVYNAASTTTRLPLPLSRFRWVKDLANGTAVASISL